MAANAPTRRRSGLVVWTRLLAEIEAHQRSKGYPPTRQELAKALGLTSTSTIHHHLWVLAVQGQRQIVEGIARGLVPRELPAVSPSRELLELASSWEANSGSSESQASRCLRTGELALDHLDGKHKTHPAAGCPGCSWAQLPEWMEIPPPAPGH
jgi:SOS-response transcriptional repressor LexA